MLNFLLFELCPKFFFLLLFEIFFPLFRISFFRSSPWRLWFLRDNYSTARLLFLLKYRYSFCVSKKLCNSSLFSLNTALLLVYLFYTVINFFYFCLFLSFPFSLSLFAFSSRSLFFHSLPDYLPLITKIAPKIIVD